MHHLLVGLQLVDPQQYATYRTAMAPVLAVHRGRFVLDVEGTAHHFPDGFAPDRVLILAFPSEAAAAEFYADPAYVAVRATHFEPAVAATHKQVLA
ncbi:MAG: DUF1330 domain-containing protein [Deltaproteobacteria bacterium]|nr:MAG: DUF1330 domain-containing protein [Deltaproteobacteria bacterium]